MARRLNIQGGIFIVETMAELKSSIEAWKIFKRNSGHEVNVKTVDVMVKKWKEVGSVWDQFEDYAGRKKISIHSRESDKIHTPCRLQQEDVAGMKKTSVHKILRKDILLTPYKPQMSQELKEGDEIKGLTFWQKI